MVETKTQQMVIHPLPKQDEFLFAPEKYVAFVAGLGSGKTFAGSLKAILKCNEGQDGMILAPTYPMLRDVTQKTFFDILDEAQQPYELNKSEGVAFVRGAKVLLRSADAPERLRGVNLNWAYLDEAALMRQEVWKIIIGRLRIGEPSAWITTTPAGFNWVYHYWVERGDEQYRIIHASTRENRYLPPEYLRDLEANYTAEFAKQEIEGDFVAFEGLVYSEFLRNIHMIRPFKIPDHWQRVRAIDYGYTNPFVCLWGALDEDKRLYIFDEHYRSKALIREHAAIIKARNGKASWTVSDWDAQDNAEMQAEGIQTRNAQKDVMVGIQKVKARLATAKDGRPRLFICENCINTLKEIGMYRWNQTKEGRNEKEEPVKEADHAMDALRYMVMEADNERWFLV